MTVFAGAPHTTTPNPTREDRPMTDNAEWASLGRINNLRAELSLLLLKQVEADPELTYEEVLTVLLEEANRKVTRKWRQQFTDPDDATRED